MIEQGLIAFLQTQTSVTSLVSSRVYAFMLPQNPTYPAITYSRDGSSRNSTTEGQTNYVGADIQIDAWANSYLEAKALQKALRDALVNYRGMMGAVKVDQVRITTDAPDLFEDEVQKYRCSTAYVFWHYE